jgi:hypothetical protein
MLEERPHVGAGAIIRPMRAAIVALVLLVGGAGAGCGGGGGGEDGGRSTTGTDAPARSLRTAEGVIRAWAGALRSGDVRAAAEFFSLPSVVSNGTPPIVLRTRGEIRAFNATLPCGARVLRTYSAGRYTTAVFRLTERPGPGSCGEGEGQTARTTFVIRNGKIRQWRRVPDAPMPSRPVV